MIEELAALKSSNATDALAELLADHELDFPHRAHEFARVLSDNEDPRILAAAERILAWNIGAGRVSHEIEGYLTILASDPTPQAAELFASLMREYRGHPLAGLVASRLGSLRNRQSARDFLDLVEDAEQWVQERAYEGIAGWGTEYRLAVQDVALDQQQPLVTRVEALKALARTCGTAEDAQLLVERATAIAPNNVEVLSALAQADLGSDVLWRCLERPLVEMLGDSSSDLVRDAALFLADRPELMTDQIEVFLQGVHAKPGDRDLDLALRSLRQAARERH